ncbi:coil containing protein [Vibrio phage vB_VneS_J26]
MLAQIAPSKLRKGSTLYSVELFEYAYKTACEVCQWRVTSIKSASCWVPGSGIVKAPRVYLAQITPETVDKNGKILFNKLRDFEKSNFDLVDKRGDGKIRLPRGFYTTVRKAFEYRISQIEDNIKDYEDSIEGLIQDRVGMKNGSKIIADEREFLEMERKDLVRVKSAFTRWKKAEEKKKLARDQKANRVRRLNV